jgi:hypothetical protein
MVAATPRSAGDLTEPSARQAESTFATASYGGLGMASYVYEVLEGVKQGWRVGGDKGQTFSNVQEYLTSRSAVGWRLHTFSPQVLRTVSDASSMKDVGYIHSGPERLVNQWTTNMWLTFLVVWETP